MSENLFSALPDTLPTEVTDVLLQNEKVRIERILSKGHTSPESRWYDQEENEWVIVLQGSGTLTFESGEEITLDPGDYLNIPAHRRHCVTWTQPDEVTIWLAVFY